MKTNLNNYYSLVAKNINPYQWEENKDENILHFEANTLPFIPECLLAFLTQMKKFCPINEYIHPGFYKLKKLIADYERVNDDRISITNSGDEAIDVLTKTFLNSGDYFITTPPTYDMFAIQGQINRGINLEIPLARKDFSIDQEKIIKYGSKKRVKLIFLVNPNNPTGSVISQESIEKIINETSVVVVVDEVYREFYGISCINLLKEYDNLVILRSFSKFAGLAGARVGYLVSNSTFTQKFEAIRMPMGVSYLSAKLAEMVLEKDRIWIEKNIRFIKKERIRLTNELKRLGFYVYPSYANFLLVKIGSKASSVCKQLRLRNIVIRDRSNKKYLEGCVRITVRSRQENNRLINALREVINER